MVVCNSDDRESIIKLVNLERNFFLIILCVFWNKILINNNTHFSNKINVNIKNISQ